VAELLRLGLVDPLVILDPSVPESHSATRNLGVEVRDPLADPLSSVAADALFERRRGKGLTKNQAIALLHTPLFFADALVADGQSRRIASPVRSTPPATCCAPRSGWWGRPRTSEPSSSSFYMVVPTVSVERCRSG